jgi:hypothetical protein
LRHCGGKPVLAIVRTIAVTSNYLGVEHRYRKNYNPLLSFLQRRGVITLVTAPGDGEVTVVTDETMGEKDPLLARLLAAATAGAPPAGPANKRKPLRHLGKQLP